MSQQSKKQDKKKVQVESNDDDDNAMFNMMPDKPEPVIKHKSASPPSPIPEVDLNPESLIKEIRDTKEEDLHIESDEIPIPQSSNLVEKNTSKQQASVLKKAIKNSTIRRVLDIEDNRQEEEEEEEEEEEKKKKEKEELLLKKKKEQEAAAAELKRKQDKQKEKKKELLKQKEKEKQHRKKKMSDHHKSPKKHGKDHKNKHSNGVDCRELAVTYDDPNAKMMTVFNVFMQKQMKTQMEMMKELAIVFNKPTNGKDSSKKRKYEEEEDESSSSSSSSSSSTTTTETSASKHNNNDDDDDDDDDEEVEQPKSSRKKYKKEVEVAPPVETKKAAIVREKPEKASNEYTAFFEKYAIFEGDDDKKFSSDEDVTKMQKYIETNLKALSETTVTAKVNMVLEKWIKNSFGLRGFVKLIQNKENPYSQDELGVILTLVELYYHLCEYSKETFTIACGRIDIVVKASITDEIVEKYEIESGKRIASLFESKDELKKGILDDLLLFLYGSLLIKSMNKKKNDEKKKKTEE